MTNYQESVKSRVDLLVYDIQEELVKERGKEDPTKEEAIRQILRDYKANDISEIRVIDGSSFKILGTSSLSNQGMVGQRTPDVKIKRSIIFEEDEDVIQLKANERVWVLSTPIMHN
ncbi:cell wall metabolism sensor histidine kinase WalK, partial [Roseibium polysiphoniae]